MNNVLEFYIKLKDMMSGGLAKVAQAAKSTSSTIVSSFKNAEAAIDNAEKKTRKMEDSFSRMAKNAGFSAKGIAMALGIGLSVAGMVSFAKESLAQSAMAENQKIAFRVMLGNKAEGEALYSKIRTWADTTPYESQNFMQSAKMLLGFGEKRKNIMPDLKQLGDVAAAQDDPTQALWGLSHAYGEVIAAGRLLGRNTLEMINYGFNPLKEISQMTGKSMAALKKEEEQGAISVGMVRKAFEHATGEGGKFNNMMVEQSKTLSGQWSTFMDLVHAKMRNFGDTLAPAAKGLMSLATSFLHLGDKTELQKWTGDTTHLMALRNELGLSNITNQRRLEIFQELKANYPSIVDNIKNEKDAIEKLIPSLEKYIGKRYLSSGILKIKEQYSDDLLSVDRAKGTMDDTYGQATATAAILATKYNVDTRGLTAGQMQDKVLKQIRSKVGPRINAPIIAGGGSVDLTSDTEKDLGSLQSLINLNKAAQTLYSTHIAGANKAQEAVAQFNKVMGIDTPTVQTGKGNKNGYSDPDATGAGEAASGIARGGPRVININGVKFMDKFELHTVDFKGGKAEVETVLHDMFLRILNSGASVQQ